MSLRGWRKLNFSKVKGSKKFKYIIPILPKGHVDDSWHTSGVHIDIPKWCHANLEPDSWMFIEYIGIYDTDGNFYTALSGTRTTRIHCAFFFGTNNEQDATLFSLLWCQNNS
jgi:hypothetical protein